MPLAVLQFALKGRKREFHWELLGVVVAFVVGVIVAEALKWPWWLVWLVLWLCVIGVIVERAGNSRYEVKLLEWRIAYAKGALNQSLEEPRDWSKGKVAVATGLLLALIKAIAELLNVLH